MSKRYRSVAILGAGAVGSYLLWGLSQRSDIDLSLCAEGARKARLETEGLYINDELYQPRVRTPEELYGVDLIIVTVKYNALPSAVEDIARMTGPNTDIISLLNGVDSEERIAEKVGMEHVIHSLIKVASERKGNHVRVNPETTIGLIYGELDPSRPKDRIEALDELFSGTGLHYRSTEYIVSEIWSKFLLNVGNNLIQSIVGVGVGAYTDSEHMSFLREKMRDEVLAVAKAKGVPLDVVDISGRTGSMVKPRARYSTLQDLDSKRHTEIDMFSGAVVRMGRELGIPTPYNEYTYHVIKALEEKNDGLFDYE